MDTTTITIENKVAEAVEEALEKHLRDYHTGAGHEESIDVSVEQVEVEGLEVDVEASVYVEVEKGMSGDWETPDDPDKITFYLNEFKLTVWDYQGFKLEEIAESASKLINTNKPIAEY